MPWKLYMITATPHTRRYLRRFAWSRIGLCPAHPGSGHDAETMIDREYPASPEEEGRALPWQSLASDPRWPTTCACGRIFSQDDEYQVVVDRIYSGAPDGRLYTLREALPPGAVYDGPWLAEMGWKGQDGRSLFVRLPSGTDFPVDAPSSDGGHWLRTGEPPSITITPSINEVGRYHGHVTAGVLTEDVEGRTFEGIPRTA